MWVPLVVVIKPLIKLSDHSHRPGSLMHKDVVALKCLFEALGHAVGLRTSDWCEAGHEVKPRSKLQRLSGRLRTAVSVRNSIGIGATELPNRASTAKTITLRTLSPVNPAVLASQATTSRSQVSITKVTLTTSLFQQGISKSSEAHRVLECRVMTDLVRPARVIACVLGQQQVVLRQFPSNTLMVKRWQALVSSTTVEGCSYSSIAI